MRKPLLWYGVALTLGFRNWVILTFFDLKHKEFFWLFVIKILTNM